MKRLRLTLLIVFLGTLIATIWLPNKGQAASYDVSASVPFPAPSQPAVINPALNNITVQNAAVTISGTCQVIAPAAIVSVWRAALLLGSVACNSGTFSLQVSLSEGTNSLVAKTANVSSIYGPDSSPIAITLQTPPTVTPPPSNPKLPPVAATPLTPAQNANFNAGAQSNLNLTPNTPFTVLPSDNQVSLTFAVGGGATPYTIELNWGDGSVDSKTVPVAGTYTFTHRYRSSGNYTVKGKVRDVLGATTEISYAVVSKDTQGPAGSTAKPSAHVVKQNWLRQYWVAPSAVGLGAVIALAFWLGQTMATTSAAVGSASAASSQSARPRTKQPKNGKVSKTAKSRGKR